MKFLSINTVLIALFLGYMINIVKNFYDMFVPPTCNPKYTEVCFKSYLLHHPRQDLYIYSSTKRHPSRLDVTKVLILDNFNYGTPFQREVELKIPVSTRNNGTLFLFIASTGSKKKKLTWDELGVRSVVEKIPLITFTHPQAATYNLLNSESPEKVQPRSPKSRPVAHLRSSISFSLLTDHIEFTPKDVPGELVNYIRLTPEGEYLPILQYNFLKTRLHHLVEIKPDSLAVNVTLDYAPASIGKIKILVHFGLSLKTLSKMGFNEKNIDEVKEIFADTNLYLLCATVVISSFHLLLDFLAFKNDISFWRGKKSMAGLSGRTVLWRAFSQIIILLFLIDENTSLLILVPTGIGTLIEFWKVKKMWHCGLEWKGRFPRLVFATHEINQAELKTRVVDAEAMKYLMYILYPLCGFGAVYSLIYLPHKSWYSWCLHSIVNGVYAFGFLFMLPQLFINYRLKSVAALPWRAFMYKAFNTFIDDIFAFIITMPTAHRVACFRDDVVFLIYLYQRWLYPVDKSRIDDSTSIDQTVDQTHEKKD